MTSKRGRSAGDVTSSSARDVFAALRCALSQDTASIADISRHLNISNNKAYRAVATLERLDYVRRVPPDDRFGIGAAAERLLQQAFRRLDIRTFMLPYLRQIATSANETAGLAIRVGWYSVRVANIESSTNVVTRANRLGAATLLSSDIGGLAILCTFTLREIQRYRRFVKSDPNLARPEPDVLNRLVHIVRKTGYATCSPDQLDAIAIPLRRDKQHASAAVTIEAPASRAVPLRQDPRLQDWLAIAAEAEAVLQVTPDKFPDAFAHLDPDQVRF
jgi:DNA-binding IclR family transcriptional regulator